MIKRPLVWMALAQITGIAGAVFDMMWLPSAFAIMVIISAVMRPCHDLYLSGRRSRAEKSDIAGHFGNSHCGNIITTVLILIFIFAGAHTAQRRMNTTYPEDISQISGKVTKIRNKSSGKQIQISCSYADRRKTICRAGTHYNLIVYVPYGMEECGEGDTIIVSGRLSDFDSAMNPGEFDAKKYYASLNVNGKVNADSISVIRHNENRLLGLIFAVKAVMQQSITKCSEAEDAGIVMSMILGDKSELDSAINVLYQRSGIAHILAISGVHISIIGMTLYRILRRAGLRFGGASVISCIIIAGYGIMTGNAVSAVRAFVMFAVSCGAQVLGRKYDMACSASLASILILLDMPLMITNSGYILSFGAIAALIKVNPVIYETGEWLVDKAVSLNGYADGYKGKYKAVIKLLMQSLSASISVSLVTVPVLLLSFGEFPLLSIFLNLAVIPLMEFVMAGGIIAGIAGIVNIYAGRFVMGVVHYTLLLFRKMCGISVAAEWSHIIPGRPGLSKIIVYYMLLVALTALHTYIRHNAKNIKDGGMFSYAVCVIVPLMALLMFFNPVRYLTVRMMYVGQGDGIYIRVPDGMNILMDAGSTDKKKLGEYTLVPSLKAGGIRSVDYAVISHLDEDHYNGILYLVQNQNITGIRVRSIIIPELPDDDTYWTIVRAAKDNGTNIISAYCGMKIEAMNGRFVLECIAPDYVDMYSDKNEGSLIMQMTYDRFAMLFTGDVQGKGEENLTEVLNEAASMSSTKKPAGFNILKVAHHGSSGSTTDEFLERVKPDVAMISCGIDNRYRHPHKETIDRLRVSGAGIIRTDESGAITVKTDGKKYGVEVFR